MNKIQKHFQNVMLVGMASKISKSTYASVWIAQHTTESRVPWLNVFTKIWLVCTFSLSTLDSVVPWAIHTLVCVLFADFTCHSYQHYILEMFLYLVYHCNLLYTIKINDIIWVYAVKQTVSDHENTTTKSFCLLRKNNFTPGKLPTIQELIDCTCPILLQCHALFLQYSMTTHMYSQ